MSEKKILTWEDITTSCQRLYSQIPKKKSFEAIVGIGRGGLIPAVILANKFNLPVYNVGISSYKGEKKSKTNIYQLENAKHFKKILLVDDLSDGGSSLKVASNLISAKEIITATLYIKEGTTFVPDYYDRKFLKKFWLLFPWEEN